MEWTRSGNDVMVRLDPGDEIHSSLCNLVTELDITGASVTSGIGRVRDFDVGYLDSSRVYQHKIVEGPVELLSLQGNIALLDGSPFSHLHSLASTDAHLVIGGHLFSAVIEITGEIHLRILKDVILTRCEVQNSDFKALGFQ